jgi:hypothetical protein
LFAREIEIERQSSRVTEAEKELERSHERNDGGPRSIPEEGG